MTEVEKRILENQKSIMRCMHLFASYARLMNSDAQTMYDMNKVHKILDDAESKTSELMKKEED